MKKNTNNLYDKALNKFTAITLTSTGKDYVDFYRILQKTNWSISKIRKDYVSKALIYVDSIFLARQFLRVVEFKVSPKTEEFFLNEAKKLKKEILK